MLFDPKDKPAPSKESKDVSKEPKDISKEPKDVSKEPKDVLKESKDVLDPAKTEDKTNKDTKKDTTSGHRTIPSSLATKTTQNEGQFPAAQVGNGLNPGAGSRNERRVCLIAILPSIGTDPPRR